MNKEQILVAELLKLKAYLLKAANAHTLRVETQEVLAKVNAILEKVDA